MTAPSPLPPGTRWSILCRVIDNFGDAGVCWRLARQLACEHAARVTLLIDRPELIDRLAGHAPAPPGTEVRRWPANDASACALGTVACSASATGRATVFPDTIPDDLAAPLAPGASPLDLASSDVIVSAFGCAPPAAARAMLAGAPARPLWIDLEYLSAESWVEHCHGLASVKPADGAVQYLFCPGFSAATGGLLRERDAIAEVRPSRAEREAILQRLCGLATKSEERLITLFCYPQAPVQAWLDALAGGRHPTLVLVPEGVAVQEVERFAGEALPTGHPPIQRGCLRLARIPFVPQNDYDRLLSIADFNFVRGEDSWIRAHWARRPFVWQPYPQEAETHLVKLNAFLKRMRSATASGINEAGKATLAIEDVEAVETMMRAWSGKGDPALAWSELEQRHGQIIALFARWTDSLLMQHDLAANLARWVSLRL